MATQSLLNVQVDKGAATLVALDDAGLDVRAALWLFDEESQDWRFVIVDPAIDTDGPHPLYVRIGQALEGDPDVLAYREIYAKSPSDPIIQRAAKLVGTPKNAVGGILLTGNAVDGALLPDMYVYRLARP